MQMSRSPTVSCKSFILSGKLDLHNKKSHYLHQQFF